MSIHPSTFDFLRELSQNNNREWFNTHKERYIDAHANVRHFIAGMIERLSAFDLHINTNIDPAKCMFRIYRDIRFSKNKDPYKDWFAAGISIDGRKLDGPEYYIHIEPEGQSFIAAGYWRPQKKHLDAIRQEVDYSAGKLIAALKQGGWSEDDLSTEDKLIRPPAGYTANDPNIEVLKLKSFILYETLPDDLLTSHQALDRVTELCQRMLPFKYFLQDAISLTD